jgi:hypothetical protein
MADELIDMAETEIEQAIDEWNTLGEQLSPDGRLALAKVYALVSIARSLDRLADVQAPEAADDRQPAIVHFSS